MKQTPLIFLDFDGVLNSQLFYVRRKNGEFSTHDLALCRDIDPEAVELLNNLIKKTDAKVVVSSTWRLGRTIKELQEILESAGFVGEVIDKTPSMNHGQYGDCILRGNEILAWIKANKDIVGGYYDTYRRYVILDDDSDFLLWQRENFFHCDAYAGLTPNVVYKAARFLNSYDSNYEPSNQDI